MMIRLSKLALQVFQELFRVVHFEEYHVVKWNVQCVFGELDAIVVSSRVVVVVVDVVGHSILRHLSFQRTDVCHVVEEYNKRIDTS